MHTDKNDTNEITEAVIGGAFKVINSLGIGFLEKVYENALVHELAKTKVTVRQQQPIQVTYEGTVVGEYVADIIVNELVLVEIKAVRTLNKIHIAQCLNYLKVTRLRTCLLINFGSPKLEIKRLAN